MLITIVAGCTAHAADQWQHLPDGSLGQVTVFLGSDGTAIPAYVRKPDGPGPFPLVMILHGGPASPEVTYELGRSQSAPAAHFLRAGWAVYAFDYRSGEAPPATFVDDALAALKTARALAFVDPARVGMLGGSRGGGVLARLATRADPRGIVLCAPAGLDLIEIKKAASRGEDVAGVLKKMVANLEARSKATAEEIERDPQKYGYASALTEAAQVKCPLLLVGGRNDNASPVAVIEVYAQKLRAAGKRVEAYRPDNGPHGFYFGHPAIAETEEAARRAVEFFRRAFGADAAR
jgi:dipeptidyl aminopeptidase/acylaminoacyl peptidase